LFDRSLKGSILQRVAGLERGSLTVKDASGSTRLGRECAHEITAEIDVQDSRFYRLTALGGGLGFAEAYLRGYWQTDDLVGVIRLMARNRHVLGNAGRGWPILTWPLSKLTQLLQRNTMRGSRRNIMAHYDLGNDFFRLFLDDTMTYSSGVFEHSESTLEEASRAKYDRICRKLALNRNDHVVEIGTGWGGFAIHAAGRYGCRVTTTTISPSQYEYARRRIAEEGLADRIDVVLRDYRELSGTYDKLVSIEMIEAVGHEYLPDYFEKCSALLKPDGMMALQAITIPEQRYERYRKSVDFIQQYVFPGGCLPSIGVICDSVSKTTDLRMTHLEDFGQHYAHTLAQWRSRFFENIASVRKLGLDDRFIRCWEYYLCYCEGGFAERQIGVAQIVLNKPNSRHQPILPSLS
jgi:cyclopropane-fatty-acyl-phospholipid synthase